MLRTYPCGGRVHIRIYSFPISFVLREYGVQRFLVVVVVTVGYIVPVPKRFCFTFHLPERLFHDGSAVDGGGSCVPNFDSFLPRHLIASKWVPRTRMVRRMS